MWKQGFKTMVMCSTMFSSRLIHLNSSVKHFYNEVVSFKKIIFRNVWSFEQINTLKSSCLYPRHNLVDKTFKHKFSLCTQHLSQSQQDVEEDSRPQLTTKLLKISIIGTPNTGKSTFINQIVGRRVFAISSKVHTTRVKARAILNLDSTQVVFLDTPGLVNQTESNKHNLELAFLRDGETAITETNIIGVMHDVSNSFTRDRLDPKVLRLLHLYPYKHAVLILNKVDTIKKKSVLLDLTERLTCKNLCDPEWKISQNWQMRTEEEVKKIAKTNPGWPYFQQVFMVSSLEGLGVGEVMEYLLQYAKPAEWMYPETVYTDQKPEQVICDAVKARILDHLPNEVPYKCKVKLELYNKLRDGTIMGVVLITSPNIRCEKMLLKRIRTIAQETESELRNTFLTQVLVKLVVQTADK